MTSDWILTQFAPTRSRAQRLYRAFVRDRLRSAPWGELRGQIYLGSEEFVGRYSGSEAQEVPREQWQPLRPPLAQILAREEEQGVLVAYRDYGYTLREIAGELGIHYVTAGRRLRALESREV